MIDHMTDIQSGATYKLSLQQGQEFTVLFYFFLLWEIFSILLLLFLFGHIDVNFADNFLSQVIFVFLLFLGMAMYANEVETKENW